MNNCPQLLVGLVRFVRFNSGQIVNRKIRCSLRFMYSEPQLCGQCTLTIIKHLFICQFNSVMLNLAKSNWLFIKGHLSKTGRLNLNNCVVVTKYISLLQGDFKLHLALSVFLFESDRNLFIILSSLSSLLVQKVHINLLNRSCLWHVLTTIQKNLFAVY